jgi:hypothetical protein
MDEKKESQKVKGAWLKVFCPNARCLTEEEILELPQEKRQAAEESGKEGLWLDVFCPDETCLTDEERVHLPVQIVSDKKGKGLWLRFFCPEGTCVIEEPTDIP